MKLYRVGWRDAERQIIYVQFIHGCALDDVFAACCEWRSLSNSVSYEVRVMINLVDVAQNQMPGNLVSYAPIARIIPPGSHEIAVVGADHVAFHLISGLLRVVFPKAINRVHFFDTIADAEKFLKHQVSL